jgi:Trypsin-like peptidase domain
VFLSNNVILTCAHIFGLVDDPSQVVYVLVAPAHNTLHESDNKPNGAVAADAVFACSGAFPRNRRLDEFNPERDLALVHLTYPVGDFNSPPFSPFAYEHLVHDDDFRGADSKLRTVGYGGPEGMMVEAKLPILEAFYERSWLEVDRKVSPGQSGAPIFYEDVDSFKRTEYRLVGVISCDDRRNSNHTIGTMITDKTEAWIKRALSANLPRIFGVVLLD